MGRWSALPILGGAYKDDTRPWASQDCLNRLPVIAERPGTRSPGMLRDAPGALAMGALGDGPIRGLHNAEGLLLVVSGTVLYTVAGDGTATARGRIPGVSRVSMAHNQITGGNEVAIANGLGGYVYNTKTTTLSQITDSGFIGAKVFDFIDGYTMGVEAAGRFWFHSDLAAATSYNTLDRAEAEAQPDKIITAKASHREWAVFGERSTEFYRNTGAATGTFQRVDGTELEIGCPSVFGVAKLDNTLYFVGHDGSGYVLQGYQPVRITTHAIEQAWSRCRLQDCYTYTLEDQGHKVWYVTFTDGQTWGYDVATQEWHRRASQGLDFWRMADVVRWNSRWIAGDYANGSLYQLDWNTSNEAGAEMERSRTFHVINDEQNRLIVNALELVYDVGASRVPAEAISLTIQNDIAVSGDVPDGLEGAASTGTYTATGGLGPYTFAVTAGTFPTGLTLGTNGAWTGTYDADGVFSWTVEATDTQSGLTATLNDTATVQCENIRDPEVTPVRYLVIPRADTTDYSANSVDDSAWNTGLARFDSSTIDGTPGTLIITDQHVWARHGICLTSTSGLSITYLVDDRFRLWINGTLRIDNTPGGSSVTTAIDPTWVNVGHNFITVCGTDTGLGRGLITWEFTP